MSFQLNFLFEVFSKSHFLIFCIELQIHSLDGGDIKIIFQLTTSGIAAKFEVIKFFHIAQTSEWTDPNHSAKDGAMIISEHATKTLKSSF